MIVIVTMKTPDALHYACEADTTDKESAKEAEEFIESKWMQYGEYLSVKFDTEVGTAEVLPR